MTWTDMNMEPILDVKQLTMNFGGLRALDEVDLDVRKGEIVALIGPNGAGKTTFFNCITGIYDPSGGDVLITSPKKMARPADQWPQAQPGHGKGPGQDLSEYPAVP
jgi:ABC-type branched-subunit amino acid transport system ATPase component